MTGLLVLGIIGSVAGIAGSILILLLLLIFGIIFLIYKYFHDEAKFIPPLDLIDAKKLDDVMIKQLEKILKEVLTSKGYAEEEINEILKRTASQSKTFRR